MRSIIAVSVLLSGCSILFNPDNLPVGVADAGGDAPKLIDAPSDAVDADPAALALVSAYPNVMYEGQGTGGSRPNILVIHGSNIAADATVQILAHDLAGPVPMVTVHNDQIDIAPDGTMLAVPITAAIDPALASAQSIRLDLGVTQQSPTGPVTVILGALAVPAPDTAVATLVGFDELINVNSLPSGLRAYSMVQIDAGGLVAADTAGPLIVRAIGSISIAGTVQVNATGQAPGAGGAGGGNGGPLLNSGSAGSGLGGGLPGGGGGGFATRGGDGTANTGGAIVGDMGLSTLVTNRGSGGAGGNGGALTSGGRGGGGGGTLELTAGGDLTLTDVAAKGANGANGSASTGGGGSGGAVLLRSGGTVSCTSITATGGTGAGAGSVGRVRVDSPAVPTITTSPDPYHGPSFTTAMPSVTHEALPTITVMGEPLHAFRYYFSNEDSSGLRGPFDKQIGSLGQNTFVLDDQLYPGGNLMCVQVEGADFSMQKPEARNCILIAYVPH